MNLSSSSQWPRLTYIKQEQHNFLDNDKLYSDEDISIKEENREYVSWDNEDNHQLKNKGISVDDFIDDLLHSSGANIENNLYQNCHSKGKENDILSNLDDEDNYHFPFCKKNQNDFDGGVSQNSSLEKINTITNVISSTPSTSRQDNFGDCNIDIFETEGNSIVTSTSNSSNDENNKKFNSKITNCIKNNIENGFRSLIKHGNGKNILKCSNCHKEFEGSVKDKVLYEHITTHIKDPVVAYKMVYVNNEMDKVSISICDQTSCPICRKRFKSEQSMHDHLDIHTNYKKYACSKCNSKLILEVDFKVHQYICINITLNEGYVTYICPAPECDLGFQSKEDLFQHITHIHTNDSITTKYLCKCYICPTPDCDVNFHSKEVLDQHIRNINTNNAITTRLPYNCSLCNKKFEILSGLTLHQKIMHCGKDSILSMKGNKYSGPTNSVQSMKAHQGIHTNYNRYTCSKCHAKFKLEPDLKVHYCMCIKNTSNEGFDSFNCPKPECNAIFQSKKALTQHFMKAHTNVTHTPSLPPSLPYKCSLCNIKFELLSGLALHQKLMHNSIKKSDIRKNIISCHECGERFNRKCDKKRHVGHCAESERKKVFKCNQCDMKFQRRDGLQLHKSILHK